MAAASQNSSKAELSSSIRELTDTIEARQDKKNQQRTKRKEEKKAKEKGQVVERLIAPIILVITILFSLFALALKN